MRFRGEVVAEVPAASLADDGPVYSRPLVPPAAPAAGAEVPLDADPAEAVLALAADPTCASKRWVWEQYDRFVGHGTVAGPGCDAAVLRVPGATRAVALATDGNGRYAALDPAAGAALAVAEAARNVACTGAQPIAVTNCLNFASPERPEVMGAFAAAVDGMAAACRALGLPVTGGNVSFYNESSGRPIHPTPIVGVLGLLDDATTAVPSGFPRPGLDVWLLGETRVELGGSVWQRLTTGRLEGRPPTLDLAAEAGLHRLLADLAARRLLAAAHDLSDGGLALALVEATLAAGVGATVELPEVLGPADLPPSPAGRPGQRVGLPGPARRAPGGGRRAEDPGPRGRRPRRPPGRDRRRPPDRSRPPRPPPVAAPRRLRGRPPPRPRRTPLTPAGSSRRRLSEISVVRATVGEDVGWPEDRMGGWRRAGVVGVVLLVAAAVRSGGGGRGAGTAAQDGEHRAGRARGAAPERGVRGRLGPPGRGLSGEPAAGGLPAGQRGVGDQPEGPGQAAAAGLVRQVPGERRRGRLGRRRSGPRRSRATWPPSASSAAPGRTRGSPGSRSTT